MKIFGDKKKTSVPKLMTPICLHPDQLLVFWCPEVVQSGGSQQMDPAHKDQTMDG